MIQFSTIETLEWLLRVLVFRVMFLLLATTVTDPSEECIEFCLYNFSSIGFRRSSLDDIEVHKDGSSFAASSGIARRSSELKALK